MPGLESCIEYSNVHMRTSTYVSVHIHINDKYISVSLGSDASCASPFNHLRGGV